ncbi:MAG: hypothetical protein C4541_06485 [Candidatus Auribacter fodinae]|jgi:4-amino-4-deoxy-L-arabinose transferase-like glycosyltransferase|uniref:Glycosyltransferase RgtA/B/C/D-like domain-containing protein n=1 Tax=Candidatus Auribacter fodinae TaxID=2093366 RepID=A0A3A4R4A1_9BACT|nr:MAG: hypothetical protein C4541_06485 [Candidatus Auribacter fodinae]
MNINLFRFIKSEFHEFVYTVRDDCRHIASKLLIGIVIIGIVLRIIAFGGHTVIHIDEALYSNWAASIGHNHKLLFTISGVDKPPLFYYLVGASMFLFGPNDQAAKLPGLAIGSLTIMLGALIAYALLRRKDASLWTAFFFALSPFEIAYGPTVFADASCMFFALAAVYAILARLPIMSGLFFGLSIITKQSAIYFLPLYAILYIIRFRMRLYPLKGVLAGVLYPLVPTLIWALLIADRGLGVFFGICKQEFFSKGEGISLFKWLAFAQYITGNWLTFILSLAAIIGALVFYGYDLARKRSESDPDRYCELIAMLLFVIGYTAMISVLQYPLYSRYVSVISGIYLVLFGIGVSIVFRELLARARYYSGKKVYIFLRLGIVAAIVYWLFAVPDNLANFPDGTQYQEMETVLPCVSYIKNHGYPAAIFYTENLWPFIPWYVYDDHKQDKVYRRPVQFKTASGIHDLAQRMAKDQEELEDKKIYFIIDPRKDSEAFDLLEQELGFSLAAECVFTAQPTRQGRPSYMVYRIDNLALKPFAEQ